MLVLLLLFILNLNTLGSIDPEGYIFIIIKSVSVTSNKPRIPVDSRPLTKLMVVYTLFTWQILMWSNGWRIWQLQLSWNENPWHQEQQNETEVTNSKYQVLTTVGENDVCQQVVEDGRTSIKRTLQQTSNNYMYKDSFSVVVVVDDGVHTETSQSTPCHCDRFA